MYQDYGSYDTSQSSASPPPPTDSFPSCNSSFAGQVSTSRHQVGYLSLIRIIGDMVFFQQWSLLGGSFLPTQRACRWKDDETSGQNTTDWE